MTLELHCSIWSPLVAIEYLKCDKSELNWDFKDYNDKIDVNYLITNFYIAYMFDDILDILG